MLFYVINKGAFGPCSARLEQVKVKNSNGTRLPDLGADILNCGHVYLNLIFSIRQLIGPHPIGAARERSHVIDRE